MQCLFFYHILFLYIFISSCFWSRRQILEIYSINLLPPSALSLKIWFKTTKYCFTNTRKCKLGIELQKKSKSVVQIFFIKILLNGHVLIINSKMKNFEKIMSNYFKKSLNNFFLGTFLISSRERYICTL